MGLSKGSGKPNTEKVGKLTKNVIEEIAKEKMDDLNTDTVDAAMNIVRGTARSMGVETE
jgi:large subunit ribosomal protein L11